MDLGFFEKRTLLAIVLQIPQVYTSCLCAISQSKLIRTPFTRRYNCLYKRAQVLVL